MGTSRFIQGLKLEASEPNIISVDKSDKFTVLWFKFSSSRPNHKVEQFDLKAKTADGIILSVFPSSVKLTRSSIFVRVVIRSINPWVKCDQPYGVILTASNKFTKLTDAFVIHVTEVRVVDNTQSALLL